MPIYSLYSETREPTAEMLAGLDALVIDLQDIGARIYTFVYTMANCLRAASATASPSSSAIARIPSAASRWKDRPWNAASNRSSVSSRFRCGTG